MYDISLLTYAECIKLCAMSTLCPQAYGYGVILAIMTNDHNPPHFHVFKSSARSKTICKYIITEELPSSVSDLVPMKGDIDLSRKDKEKILSWATSLDSDADMVGWKYAKIAWKKEAGSLAKEKFPTIEEAKKF